MRIKSIIDNIFTVEEVAVILKISERRVRQILQKETEGKHYQKKGRSHIVDNVWLSKQKNERGIK